MDQPDTVLNFSEIRPSKRGSEPLPINDPQQSTPLPFLKSSPTISATGTDSSSVNPHARLATDSLGQELRPQASIWKMYVEEAAEQDAELVDVQNKNLDLMLLFAALFSAILTAFLIESTNMLRKDPVDESASLLLFIAQSQRRIELGIPAEVLNPIESGKFSPTLIARFINGLWFTALALSLSAALIAMLAKEWLASYLATSIRPAYERSLARQAQFDGLVAWHTLPIISFLPTFLHLSLLLFSLGLVAYLWDLDTGIAIFVAVITGLTMVFYVATLVCGVAFDPCPFVTQLSKYIRTALFLNTMGWKPKRIEIPSETLIAHGSITKPQSRALSWLVKSSHDPAVVDCVYEAVAGHVGINPGTHNFTGSQSNKSTSVFSPHSPESNNVLFFTSLCTRLSELIQQGPKATKTFHGPSLARYASALPKLLLHIEDKIGAKEADFYLQQTKNTLYDNRNYSIKDCASTALMDIESTFSNGWGPFSADEYALLSTAHLSLVEILARAFTARAPTPPPSPSRITPLYHLRNNSHHPVSSEHLPSTGQPSPWVPQFQVLISTCGLSLARTSIQLRYHLNHQAHISEAYLICLLKAISATLAQKQLRDEATCSIRVVGAATETHLPPSDDRSHLSHNTLIETLLKLIVDDKITQAPEFFSSASEALAQAASPHLNTEPSELTQQYWPIPSNKSPEGTNQPPTSTEEMTQNKIWVAHQALAISTLPFATHDWLPVTALYTLDKILKDAATWPFNALQLDHSQLIEHWVHETYRALFNQTTGEHESLAKVAQHNLIGSVGQLIILASGFDGSPNSWDRISWENTLVPLLTIISLTPRRSGEVGAILRYLTSESTTTEKPAFKSMLRLLRSSKGFELLWAIRQHAGYATEIAVLLNDLFTDSRFQLSEDNINGLLEEVFFIFNNKTPQITKADLIGHVIGQLENAHERKIDLPQNHHALIDIQRYLEKNPDTGGQAKLWLEKLKYMLNGSESSATDSIPPEATKQIMP